MTLGAWHTLIVALRHLLVGRSIDMQRPRLLLYRNSYCKTNSIPFPLAYVLLYQAL